LMGVDLSLQGFVGGIQPLIRDVGFCLYAVDDLDGGGFFATRLEARPKHLGPTGERNDYGQHRDRTQYPCHVSTSIPLFVSR
jgi:hypothetical protein